MKKPIAIAAAMLFLLTSCVKERKFTVDEGLLEKRTENAALKISYCPPSGFNAVRQGVVDTIAAQELSHDPFSGKITALYVDTLVRNSTMIVRDLAAVPEERTENKLDFYFTEFNPNGFWDGVEIERYRFGDFKKVVQLDMQNKDSHLIKLFFYGDGKARFSVDYMLPQEFYNDLLPFIESSIGSFQDFYEFDVTVEDNPSL